MHIFHICLPILLAYMFANYAYYVHAYVIKYAYVYIISHIPYPNPQYSPHSLYGYIYIYIYRSEGFPRTGYLIPGCDGDMGLDWLGNSSRRAAAVAAAAVAAVAVALCLDFLKQIHLLRMFSPRREDTLVDSSFYTKIILFTNKCIF